MTQTYIPCPNCRDRDKEGRYDRCMSWHLYQTVCRPHDTDKSKPQKAMSDNVKTFISSGFAIIGSTSLMMYYASHDDIAMALALNVLGLLSAAWVGFVYGVD